MNYQQRFGPYQLQPYGFTPAPMPPPAASVPSQQAVSGTGLQPDQPIYQNPMQASPWRGIGAQQGGIRSAEDARDLARSGVMDQSLGNLGNLGRIAMGFMGGPMGIGMLGAQAGLASQLGIGKNPFSFEGYSAIDPDLVAGITSNNPNIARAQLAEARKKQMERNAARAGLRAEVEGRTHEAYGGGGRGAVDSHGQVSGGGTGSRGGGTTQGGPR